MESTCHSAFWSLKTEAHQGHLYIPIKYHDQGQSSVPPPCAVLPPQASQCLTRVPTPEVEAKVQRAVEGSLSTGGRWSAGMGRSPWELGAWAPPPPDALPATQDGCSGLTQQGSAFRVPMARRAQHQSCLLQPWPSPGTHLGALTLLLPGRGWPTERTLGTRVHPCPLTLFKKLARECRRLGHAQKAFRTGSWVVGTAPRPPHATHAAGPGAVCRRQGPEGSGRASPQTRCTWALYLIITNPRISEIDRLPASKWNEKFIR